MDEVGEQIGAAAEGGIEVDGRGVLLGDDRRAVELRRGELGREIPQRPRLDRLRSAAGAVEAGQIEIGDRFSLVEVGNDVAEEVINALRGTTIRGKKMTVRRERFER